ncbi:MAG: hypothetical protein JW981_08635, partial [Anaerolineae bacterium]|nr:hypothetical protein [Anaerolineae bacterium]
FIHHSTGGNWLADPNNDQPYGGLGMALRDNNYFVSATNYGWGPDSIGDRTDIPNWPEWFTGPDRETYLDALYNESDQNIGDFGAWSRLASGPGGENQIIMFKSCFPNSDLYGAPDDLPAAVPNAEYTVSNAKAVYDNLLTYFETRQDKLFIVITAPPMAKGEYGSDAVAPKQRAANARAFNNWLVNDWLSDYAYNNVAVFDYYNVLTAEENHHRWVNGAIEHTQTVASDFSAYPSDPNGDSHPTTAGHQKATAEFVPLLNVYFNRWQSGSPPVKNPPTATPVQELPPAVTPEQDAPVEDINEPPNTTMLGVIDAMEAENYWESYGDDKGSTVESGLDTQVAHSGDTSLRITYEILTDGWGDSGRYFESHQDWSGADGLSFWLQSEEPGQVLALVLLAGNPEASTPFIVHFETPEESVQNWVQFNFAWSDFARAEWADDTGLPAFDPKQVVGLGFNFVPVNAGVFWIDDLALISGDIQPPPVADTPDEPESSDGPEPVATTEPIETDSEDNGTGLCPAALLPLAMVIMGWRVKRKA